MFIFDFESYLYLLASIIVLLLIFVTKKNKGLLSLILVISTFRLVTISNGAFWNWARLYLTEKDIGARERIVAARNYTTRFYDRSQTEHLFYGSSQIYHLVRNLQSKTKGQVSFHSMPYFNNIDYFAFKDNLKIYDSDNIYLYLSEINLVDGPKESFFYSYNFQGMDLLKILPLLKYVHVKSRITFYTKFLLKQFIPEYRYNYVFRAIILKFFGVKNNRPTKSLFTSVYKETEIIDFFKQSFELFINSIPKNKKIIILESQFKNLNYPARRIAMRKFLFGQSKKYKNVTFYDENFLGRIPKKEFIDESHIDFDYGEKFLKRFFKKTNTDIKIYDDI